jgi:hypothetical protein
MIFNNNPNESEQDSEDSISQTDFKEVDYLINGEH